MCWVWVICSINSYYVIHFTSLNPFPHGNTFPNTGQHYRACQCEVTGASTWWCRKDSSLKCSWIFSGATWLWIKTKKDKSVNNQVVSASEAQNLKVKVVIMCCLVSAATHQRVQWYVRRENGGFMNWQRKLKRPGEKNLLQCPFIHQESHTKWCKIQLQLYSQRTAHNYLISGLNNIHLKCAQQNCMDTALILHWPLIKETIQNTGK